MAIPILDEFSTPTVVPLDEVFQASELNQA